MNRESGFTLIEALIAMIILIVGLVAIANLFVVASSSNQIGNYTTVTTATASDVMEKLKAVPFVNLTTYTGPYFAADPWNPPCPPPFVSCPDHWAEDTTNWSTLTLTACDVTNLATAQGCTTTLPGVGTVITRWKVIDPGAGGIPTRFILVRSEVQGLLGRSTRAQFSTFRACVASSCP